MITAMLYWVINHSLTVYAAVLETLYKVINVDKWTVSLHNDIMMCYKPSSQWLYIAYKC